MEKFTSKDKKDKKDKDSKESNNPPKAQSQKLTIEFIGLFFLLLGALIFLSLVTYSPSDPTLNTSLPKNAVIANKAGLIGAYLSALLVDLFGIGSYVWGVILVGFGSGFLIKWLLLAWKRFFGFFLFGVNVISLASAWKLPINQIVGGGFSGDYLYTKSLLYFSPTGSAFIWVFTFLLATQLIFGISWLTLFRNFFIGLVSVISNLVPEKKETDVMPIVLYQGEDKKEKKSLFGFMKRKDKDPNSQNLDINVNESKDAFTEKEDLNTSLFNLNIEDEFDDDDDEFDDITELSNDDKVIEDSKEDKETKEDSSKKDKKKGEWSLFSKKKKDVPKTPPQGFTLPSSQLLSVTPATDIKHSPKALTEKGQLLIQALNEYNIQAELVRVTPGPVITMYEIHPAAGVRVSKIAALSDDLAMKLKAVSIRIQAPIPGNDTVGIEVPNETRANVSFRELIEGSAFTNSTSFLSLALGKNISGAPFATELAKMPHLLVAGATGAGKSVCLNTIILSILYKAKPDDVKLMLVDPKRIELSIYEDLPHLVHPVITEMQLAKNALLWAIDEMDRRYRLLEDMKVRNIISYNEKVAQMPKPEIGEENETEENQDEKKIKHENLPYLLIVIDELADLMMTHGKDVEGSIVRLGQLARAAGIHIILATQRPSVNVVTGLIKANFPCRISFQVSQKTDSRTILDSTGAETLLGKGDMLFKPPGGSLQRLHGAFVPDDDVKKIVDYWKNQGKPDYKLDFTVYGEEKVAPTEFGGGRANDISQEQVYQDALELLPSMDRVTISALQRRLRIGFNKAALIKEQLEKDGLIQEK